MTRSNASRLAMLLFAALAAARLDAQAQAGAPASTKYYRRSVSDFAPGIRYTDPVPANARGTYYRVETDAAGRIVHVVSYRNGTTTGDEWRYTFDGNAPLSNGSRYTDAGEDRGYTKYVRDAKGQITRTDDYTAANVLTGSSTSEYFGDTLIISRYLTAAGVTKSIGYSFYGSDGLLHRTRSFANPDSMERYSESDFDPAAGRIVASRQIRDGKAWSVAKYSYNADGDRTRADFYDPDGAWTLADEYTDNLWTKRTYKSGKELHLTYNASRLLTETQLWFGGKMAVRFTYDRLPDYTVKRTLAVGPNGDLWAEYPDQFVRDVERDGRPTTHQAATIYHKDNWW